MRPWLGEHPEADFAELETVFGTPEVIAAAYLDEMPAEELLAKLSVGKTFVAVLAITAALGLVIWISVLCCTAAKLQQENKNDMIYIYPAQQDGMGVYYP